MSKHCHIPTHTIIYTWEVMIYDTKFHNMGDRFLQNAGNYVSTKPQCCILEDQNVNSHTVNVQVLYIFSLYKCMG